GNVEVDGITKFGDGGDANYVDVNSVGQLTLHGDAEVLRHLRIGSAEWGRGTNAPATGEEGVWATLDFVVITIFGFNDLYSGID
ncbi:unnamed protein product, partial [marine sediment metagenome]